MIKNFLSRTLTLVSVIIMSISAMAQTADMPNFHILNFSDGAIVQNMSDNGEYAVAYGKNPANDTWSFYPRLIDLSTDAITYLLSPDEELTATSVAARDVSNDGSIVVGTYNCLPGIWRKSTGKWETLPVPAAPANEQWCDGYVAAITPDGKYAVGTMSYKSLFGEQPVMWSLEGTPSIIETPNWPDKGLSGINQEQTRFIGITPDGKKILGCVSYSYPGDTFYFLYNRDSADYEIIGYEKVGAYNRPLYNNGLFINSAVLSPNGKYVAGTFYIAEPIEGSEFYNEYTIVYRHNVETSEFETFDTQEDKSMIVPTVGNDGTLYGASPSGSAARTWSARIGNYWYSFDQVMIQCFGADFTDKTGFENSGTAIAVSEDNLRFASFPYPMGESYVVDLPKSMAELTKSIDLLGEYVVTPAPGTSFSMLSNIELQFNRDVEVIADKADIELRDADGNVVKTSIKFALKSGYSKNVEIGFRTVELEADKEYFVVIPEGAINVAGDASKINKEISIKYVGRENTPVKVVSVNPKNEAVIERINLTTSPIVVNYDATLAIGENPLAHLYLLNEDGSDKELITDMYLMVSANQVLIYPLNEQRLYKGSTYKVIIDANSVYDIMGNNGNEEFELTYIGNYEREIVVDGNVLFEESFDDYNVALNNMMLFEGDHLTPVEEIATWGFDADNTPWWLVRSNEENFNNAAGSHSMYNNNGTADDWMVIPQLYITDETCQLIFDSQSYRNSAQDKLSVYIWENEDIINTLTSATITDFRKNAVLIYNEIQSPGASEDELDNDWRHNVIELKQYAGKSIYIAFVNENTNQSAIFIDNVKVTRSVDFVIALESESTMAAQAEAEITGRVRVESETLTFSDITLTLYDDKGNELETNTESGISLKKGDIYPFTFEKKLPLELGSINKYTVKVRMGEVENNATGTIKNLHFVPTKRVVMEEGTGQGCQNCPLGHQMIEKLHQTYGDKFIPIAIHTYSGDIYGAGMAGYSSFLGIMAYPSAMINRSGRITSPMESYIDDSGNTLYRYSNPEKPLWWDEVATEFESYADADINIINGATFDKEAGTIRVPVEVKYALDMENLNVNLFAVVLENNLKGYQKNGFFQVADPILGEWGQGGIYGQETVAPYFFNEVARGVFGVTYNGTGGLIPDAVVSGQAYNATIDMNIPKTVSNIENCDIVVMMIDANTDKVINAVKGKIYDVLSVDNVASDNLDINVIDNRVVINSDDEMTAEIYAADGTKLAQNSGYATIEMTIDNYTGVAIVRVVENEKAIVKKIIIR